MIGKHTKGKSPYRLVQYLITKPTAQVLTSNLGSDRPSEIAHELQWGCQLNPRTKLPIYHASLGLLPQERLSDSEWRNLARDYLRAMGFDACPYLVVRHNDRRHDHIHIAASRVRLDNGKCVSDSWDHLRCQTVLRNLEQCYGLQTTPSSWEQDRKAATVGMMRLHDRTGQALIKPKLQALIDQTCEHCSTVEELIDHLQQQGIETRLKATPTGALGISYGWHEMTFSGSQLGRAYTVRGLAQYRQLNHTLFPLLQHTQAAETENGASQQQWVNALLPTLQRLMQDSRYQMDETSAWVEPYWLEWDKKQVSVEATDGRGLLLKVKLGASKIIQSAKLQAVDVAWLESAAEPSMTPTVQQTVQAKRKQAQQEL